MLTQIRSKKGLPASRLEDFIEQMPKGCLSIFKVNDWRQPWGFGIGNGLEAGQLYKDAMITLDMADTYDFEDDWNLNDEDEDNIVIAFKEGDKVGIVGICQCPGEIFETMEDIVNHLIKSKTLTPPTPSSRVDKLDIPKMSLFK
jgi:hypothetical protein